MSQAASTSKRVVTALKNAGIKGEDLRTESISLYPQQDEMGQSIIGYTASSTVHATMTSRRRVRSSTASSQPVPSRSLGRLCACELDAQFAQAVAEAFDDARSRA